MELKDKTVNTLIEMDEPEALLALIRREAQSQKGARWQALAKVLDEAQARLDLEQYVPKPISPEATKPADTEAKAE